MLIDESILNHPKITVGFSGGVDSVVLLHWLYNNGYNVEAIHVNHNINPKSREWATFCRVFCDEYSIPITIIDGDISPFGSNIENAARELRHQSFAKVDGPIVLAHHTKDQIETFLFKLFRGAGIEGLTCMKSYQIIKGKEILRPMLSVDRNDIIKYAEKYDLEWVEDPSNADTTYDRNFIRNNLIPAILKRFPAFIKNILHVINSFNESVLLLDDLAKMDAHKCLDDDRGWDIRKLNELSDQRLKNMVKWYLRLIGEYTYSHTTLNEFVKAVRNCNPNAKTIIMFGDMCIKQRGYSFAFKAKIDL